MASEIITVLIGGFKSCITYTPNGLVTASKKNNLSLHGYFIASGIESLYLITTTNENLEFYNNKFGTQSNNNFKLLINNNIYRCLSQNIDSINIYFQKEKLIKINTTINNKD